MNFVHKARPWLSSHLHCTFFLLPSSLYEWEVTGMGKYGRSAASRSLIKKKQLQGINAGKNYLDAVVRQERRLACVGLRHLHSWTLPLVPHLWQLFVSKRCLFPTPFIAYCGFLASCTGTVLAGGPAGRVSLLRCRVA